MKTSKPSAGFLGHPFWQAILLLACAYVVFKFGIPRVPPLFGIPSAPVPQSVLLEYMGIALVAILIYVSNNEQRWTQCKEPINAALGQPDKRVVRSTALVVAPLLVGFVAFDQTRPRVSAPLQLRSIHPAPPGQITFRGKSMNLATMKNPL